MNKYNNNLTATSIKFPVELKERIMSEILYRNITMSDFIRECIEQFFKRKDKNLIEIGNTMNLDTYLSNLNKMVKERPELLKLEVITSKDDEGNGYNYVGFSPSVGHMDEDREFTEEKEINCICVN